MLKRHIVFVLFLVFIFASCSNNQPSVISIDANTGKDIIPLHFVYENYCFKKITINQDMIEEIYSQYEHNGSKFIIFRKIDDSEYAHGGMIADNATYDFGEVSALELQDTVKFEVVDLYGEELVKIKGSHGAIYSPSAYYAITTDENGVFPNLVLSIENYNSNELDIDGDGLKEIVEFSMGTGFMHKYINNSFSCADLINDTEAKSISFENGLFIIKMMIYQSIISLKTIVL